MSGFACYSGDMVFSNFVYAGSSVASSNVNAFFVNAGISPPASGHSASEGWNFAPTNGAQWNNTSGAFTIGFEVSICTSGVVCNNNNTAPDTFVTGEEQQQNTVPDASAFEATFTYNTSGSPLVLNTNGGSLATQSAQGAINSATVVSISSVYNGQSTGSSGGPTSEELDVTEFNAPATSSVPEPTAILLFGSVLVGIGAVTRKRGRSPCSSGML